MKQILLIDREFGAGGGTIGQRLAARLNWRLFDDALTQDIAQEARISPDDCRSREERVDPWLQRLVNLIWKGTFDRNLASPDLDVLNSERLVAIVRRTVERAAEKKPCVIIGRGSPYFLRNRADSLCVFLYASRESRFRRVLKRVGDRNEAIHLVDTMDSERRKFVKHHFGQEWPNRALFHAMLSTDAGDEIAAETILNLLGALNRCDKAVKP